MTPLLFLCERSTACVFRTVRIGVPAQHGSFTCRPTVTSQSLCLFFFFFFGLRALDKLTPNPFTSFGAYQQCPSVGPMKAAFSSFCDGHIYWVFSPWFISGKHQLMKVVITSFIAHLPPIISSGIPFGSPCLEGRGGGAASNSTAGPSLLDDIDALL